MWLADGVVVRRHDNAAAHTIEWIHRVLDQLDFDSPSPVLVYPRARGVQIVTKQRARGVQDDGPIRRLEWLERNGEVLR